LRGALLSYGAMLPFSIDIPNAVTAAI
jgi:hypothetical protein